MSDGFDAVAPVSNDPPATQTNDSAISAREAASALANRRWGPKEPEGQERELREPPAQISREADAAPLDEAPGETDQGTHDPAEQPPIEPPRSWTKEDKEAFRTLPRDAQERLANIERLREVEFRRSQNEAAEQRKAAEAEALKAQQARQQYEQQIPALVQALQSIQNRDFADIKTWADVERMAIEDPVRHARWQVLKEQSAQAMQQYQYTQQRQKHEQSQRFAQWAQEQDKAFQDYAKEFADEKTYAKASEEVASYLTQDVGLPKEFLFNAWNDPNGMFHLRDAKVQRILRDAARWNAAQKAAKDVRAKPVPPVQRPGTASSRQEQGASNIQALSQKLERTGNPRDAAALLVAKRAAAARR